MNEAFVQLTDGVKKNIKMHNLATMAGLRSYGGQLVGVTANFVGLLALLPSMRYVRRKKTLAGFSVTFLSMMLAANILWIVYGIATSDLAITLMGIIFSLYYTVFLYWKLRLKW